MVNVSRSRTRVLNRLTVGISAFLIGAGFFSSSIPPLSAQGSPVSGTWVGGYSCGQGSTGLRLTIQNPQGSLLTATFAFYPVSTNAGAASGSFAMTGSYQGNRVTLRSAHWIHQPFGYEMVSLQGQVSGAELGGSIIGPGCSTFSVSRPTPARVAVVTSGFSQKTIASSTDISFGVELKNESLAVDAFGISVTATFVDKYGRSVASESHSLTGIPAGKVFYYGGFVQSNISLAVAAMHIAVTATVTEPKKLVLPPVSDVRVTSATLGEDVTGQLTNPYRTPLPSDADVYAVFVDANGKIVGGAQNLAQAQVEPGATVSFSFSEYPPPEIVSAKASVDPCDWEEASFEGDQCPLTLPSVPIGQVPGY